MDEKNHDGTTDSDPFQEEGKRLATQLKELSFPDGVISWIQKHLTSLGYAYSGVTHVVNLQAAGRAEDRKLIQELKDRCEKLEAERDAANAAIGQLQVDLLAISERQDRMAEWAKKQQQKSK